MTQTVDDRTGPVLADMSLEGRTAIVTGAGRGIGRTIAIALAEAGADVVVAARTVPEIEATAEAVRQHGRGAVAVATDVSRSDQVDALVQAAIDRFGHVDVMVNNAGYFREQAVVPFPDTTLAPPDVTRESSTRMTDEEWRSIIDTNIGGVFYGCRAVAPHMLERRSGKIINISSCNAHMAYRLEVAYDASKAAVNMLTRTLALEWAPYNVTVNAIGPGEYNTSMTAGSWSDPERRKAYEENIPLGRGGDFRNLGALAIFMASPASDYMTGQTVYMDGGLTAR